MKPVIVFIWSNMHIYGGVHTFLLDCLERLPALGYEPCIFDVGHDQGPLDEYLKSFGPAIVRFIPEHHENEIHYWARVHNKLKGLAPALMVFIESRYAEDVLRGVPEAVPAINMCLVDRPDEEYYRHAAVLAPRMSLLVGNSSRIVSRLREELTPQYRDRIRHMVIGVETPANPKVRSARHPLKIIFMARLQDRQKRARDVIPFARELATLGADFRLSIVGQGPEEASIREQLSGLIADGRVEVIPVMGPAARRILDEHDVSLLFSEYEGQPMTLLDALVRGIVPVVSDVKSGMADILQHGVNGLLFPIGRPEQAARLVKTLSENDEDYRRLSKGALELGQNFTVGATFQQLDQLLREALPAVCGSELWNGWRVPDACGTGKNGTGLRCAVMRLLHKAGRTLGAG